MEITPATLPCAATSPVGTRAASVLAKVEAKEQVVGVQRVDFSHITPRQLSAYLDEMVIGDKMDISDASVLIGAITTDTFECAPDTPINLRAELKGTMKFYENRGDTLLATWYAGLMNRLETMEKQSIHVSVYA